MKKVGKGLVKKKKEKKITDSGTDNFQWVNNSNFFLDFDILFLFFFVLIAREYCSAIVCVLNP